MRETALGVNAPQLCNEAVAPTPGPDERARIIDAAAKKIEELFDVLQITHRGDDNIRDTPQRVAKMYVEELLYGRYNPPPRITEFYNAASYDQLIVTGPLEVRSTCAHHLMPIHGEAFIGILPSPEGKIVGLSKYDRIVHYFSSRLQMQEELVAQIGEFIVEHTQPRGLAVRISAVHMCRAHRGVKGPLGSRMVTNSLHGKFLRSSALREEFLRECLAITPNF